MAKFSADMPSDIIEQFRKLGAEVDDIAPKMAQGGAEVLAEAVRTNAEKYKRTGELAKSVTVGKPKKDKNGVWCCMVYFKGQSKTTANDKAIHTTYTRKTPVSNSSKALKLEYGTSDQLATPILRPALISKNDAIEGRIRYEFEKGIKK